VLSLVVNAKGVPQDITVTQGLGHGLDEAATAAVKHWRFDPGSAEGKVVPVEFTVEVKFSLHGDTNGPAFPGPVALEDANKLFNLADDARLAHDCATAIRLANRVIELDPQHWGAWNELGLCYLNANDLSAAENAFKRQIEVTPGHYFAYNNLGRVYLDRREYDKALVEFRKQLELTPHAQLTLGNVALVLRDQRKYQEAIVAYQQAIEVSPNNSTYHAGLLDCYLALGMQDEAAKTADKTAALTTSGAGWNGLAWTLAEHNSQLDRAQRYAKLAIASESANLMTVTLDPLTPDVYARVRSLVASWDTLGWILFLRGDNSSAEKYLLAAWNSSQDPTVGDHLAQAYEKLGHSDDALKYSALTIAALPAMELPQNSDFDAASNSRERIDRLTSSEVARKLLRDTARTYSQQNSVTIPNQSKQSGKAQFAILQAQEGNKLEARLVIGDPPLQSFASAVATQTPRVPVPGDEGIDVARWGILTCPRPDAECTLKIATASEATYAELRSRIDSLAIVATSSTNSYSSDSLGFALNLPDDWSKTSEQAATGAQPAMVTFTKKGTLCSLVVARRHLEATEDTFNKLIESGLEKNESFHLLSSGRVVRDGVGGARTVANFDEDKVEYHMIIETFTAGDLHYQLLASAPLDDYDRYSAELDKLLGAVRFPALHVDAKDLKPLPK